MYIDINIVIRVLLFGVCTRAPDFWTLPFNSLGAIRLRPQASGSELSDFEASPRILAWKTRPEAMIMIVVIEYK